MADYLSKQHADAIVELMGVYASDICGGGVGLSDSCKTKLVSELASRPFAFSILATVNDQYVGLANCFEGFSTFACQSLVNIHDVIVLPEFRNQGICQLLLQAIETEARRRDCCKLTMEVLAGNTPAQKAYRKYGFEAYQLDVSLGKAMFWEMKLT